VTHDHDIIVDVVQGVDHDGGIVHIAARGIRNGHVGSNGTMPTLLQFRDE
jgi:hypothetical protein